jgi:hypothetical protein
MSARAGERAVGTDGEGSAGALDLVEDEDAELVADQEGARASRLEAHALLLRVLAVHVEGRAPVQLVHHVAGRRG